MTETATTDNAKAQRDEELQRILQAGTNLEQLIKELCPDGVPFVEIGSVIKPSFGQRITKTANQGTRYPVYGGGGESFRTDEFNRQDDFVISRFALSEECVRFVKGRFWLLDSGFTIEVVQPVVNKRFVYHFLLSI